MSLKVTDVKRLKKSQLLELLEKSSLSTDIRNPTKEQLINCLQSAGLCETSSSSQLACDTGVNHNLPVNLDSVVLHYLPLCDDQLVRVPNVSFMQLYSYCCGSDAESMKSLDRAAKHITAGDVGDLKICQVT